MFVSCVVNENDWYVRHQFIFDIIHRNPLSTVKHVLWILKCFLFISKIGRTKWANIIERITQSHLIFRLALKNWLPRCRKTKWRHISLNLGIDEAIGFFCVYFVWFVVVDVVIVKYKHTQKHRIEIIACGWKQTMEVTSSRIR